jgi:26S proteasome regulatory subunit N1
VKDQGIMTAVGLLGFVYYQNFEEFSSLISDYFDLKDGYAKAGACIALGLTTSGVVDENDPTFALLTECIESQDAYTKMGACIGLGISYANMRKNELKEMLPQIINDENLPLEVSVNASIALSLSFI